MKCIKASTYFFKIKVEPTEGNILESRQRDAPLHQTVHERNDEGSGELEEGLERFHGEVTDLRLLQLDIGPEEHKLVTFGVRSGART